MTIEKIFLCETVISIRIIHFLLREHSTVGGYLEFNYMKFRKTIRRNDVT